MNEHASSIYVSPQIERVLGYTQQEWLADPDLWRKVLHPDDRSRALAENDRHNETGDPFVMEYRMFAQGRPGGVGARPGHDGPGRPRGAAVLPRRDDGHLGAETRDEHVAFLAYHDELTGLPSRSMFEELLTLSIDRAQRHDGAVAAVCVDVDDFRLVNDSLGHQLGDQLLRMVADRLRESTRETDLVARRGGDQFLLLLADMEREERGDVDAAVIRAEAAAQRVHESLTSPFVVASTELYISVSMGISLFPQDGSDPGRSSATPRQPCTRARSPARRATWCRRAVPWTRPPSCGS